jgi:hypothetical protein
MPSDPAPPVPECNCLVLRQAARHVTRFYDQCLAPSGLRTMQFSILATVRRRCDLRRHSATGAPRNYAMNCTLSLQTSLHRSNNNG